ncbi:MAG: FliM/FliN family flagellar motor switch protein [Pseudomonadales bacterium]|nr:FliM/FliN family flagellar motor switch protein [Pseudomonadales bacterium]
MSDLLSQNEIDALLHGVGGDEEQQSSAEAEDYVLYDLTSGMHRVKGWSQEIQAADERMQASLSIKLLGLLHKSVEVKRQDIRIEKYGKYVKSLYVPTSMTTFLLSGMVGFSAIVLDAKLVFALVNAFFGGGSRPTQVTGREFTHTEQRVIKLILKTIIDAIKDSWKEISTYEFTITESEMNPAHLSAYNDSDVLMIRPFRVEFAGGGGEIQLLMPGNIIDALFRNKKSKLAEAGLTSADVMRAVAHDFDLDVTGELSGARLTIGEVFKMSRGDIIGVDSPEEVDVNINGITKFKARMGELNGKVGLEILNRV